MNRTNKKPSFWQKEYSLKAWVLYLVTFVLGVGFIFPLFAEVIIGTLYPNHVAGVTVWNQFTSIILGVVATVLSLVSMFMGFKSYDDSARLQETCIKTLERLESMRKQFDRMESRFNVEADVRGAPTDWRPEAIKQRKET